MNGSPSSVLTLGLGEWGGVGLVVTLGLGTGVAGGAEIVGVLTVEPRLSATLRLAPQYVGQFEVAPRTAGTLRVN